MTLPGGTEGNFLANGSSYITPPGWNADLTVVGTTWKLKFRKSNEVWTFTQVPGASYEGYLNSIADRNGNTITFNYNTTKAVGDNAWPAMTSITDTFGHTVSVGQNASNQTTSATDWTGRGVGYTITSGNLVTFTDAATKTTQYGYDTNGYLNKIITPTGNQTKMTYYTDGRVNTVTRVTNVGEGTGPTWTFTYGSYAYDSGSGTWLGTTTIQDPNGHNTVYTRDTADRITKTVDADSHTHSKAYTPNNDVSSIADGLSNALAFTYNTLTNNMTKAQAPNVSGTQVGYSESYTYTDSLHPYQANQVTTPQGNHVAYTYDTPGNATKATDDLATQNNYQQTYNADGTIHTTTNALSGVTTYNYTAHQLTSITNISPLGNESFTYDTVGRIKTHVDGKGQTTTYTFSAMDRLTLVQFTGGSSVSYTYDDNGNLTNRTDPSGSYVIKYDSLERPYEKDFPVSGSSSVVYDGASNITSYTDANGTVTYGYDPADLVNSLAQPGGSCTAPVSLCTTFGYNNNNARTTTAYPNGVTQTIGYDNAGREKTIVDTKGASTLDSFTYSYTNASTNDQSIVQSKKDNLANLTTKYTYDQLDRLKTAPTTNGSGATTDNYTYTWDGNSNRTSWQPLGSGITNATYNTADELTNTAYTWTHDANGNMTAGTNGFSASYNTANQTSSITQASGSATSMSYADFGQSERTQEATTAFLTGLLGLQSQTTGGVTTSYVRDPYGNLVAQHSSAGNYYYLFDNIGSVIGLTNSSGTLAQSFSYDPFGKLLTTSITVDSGFKFAGGYYDTATKLYHFGDRYYDPNLGQWVQRDTPSGTIASPVTENMFSYTNGNPVNFVDPTGHDSYVTGCVDSAAISTGAALFAGGEANPYAAAGIVGGGCAVGAYETFLSNSGNDIAASLLNGEDALISSLDILG